MAYDMQTSREVQQLLLGEATVTCGNVIHDGNMSIGNDTAMLQCAYSHISTAIAQQPEQTLKFLQHQGLLVFTELALCNTCTF